MGDKVLEAPLACVSADKIIKKEEEDGLKNGTVATEDGTGKTEDGGGSNCKEFSLTNSLNRKAVSSSKMAL